MKKIVLAALLCATLTGAHAAGPNLVVDGSFESQVQAAGTFGIYAAIPGWTTLSGSGIEVRNSVVGTAFSGVNFVELDSNNNSAMSQTIATSAGALYTLSFDYSGRAGVASASNPIEVLWNGNAVATVTADGSGFSDNAWHLYSYTLTGTGHDTLTFAAVGTNDSLGGSLDAVSLTSAVPEPSTALLLAGGMLLIGWSLRQRRSTR